MPMQISAEIVGRGLAEEIGRACESRLGESMTVAPAPAATGTGWLFTVPVSGAARGVLTAWFERHAGLALCRRAHKLDADPSDDDASRLLREVVAQAVTTLETKPSAAGVTTGELAMSAGPSPAQAQAFDLTVAGLTCHIAVVADLPPIAAPAPAPPDLRLEAVFDVDLPLIVRFGRTVMPLRALADLGPGSVVDMGRAPDDPVDLLVGERLIARGEVVIVGGNYGVRITELMNGQPGTTELEARR